MSRGCHTTVSISTSTQTIHEACMQGPIIKPKLFFFSNGQGDCASLYQGNKNMVQVHVKSMASISFLVPVTPVLQFNYHVTDDLA